MEALRWLFDSRGRSWSDQDAGGIRTLRLAQRDMGLLTALDDDTSLRAYAGILHSDSLDDRRDIVREIREADPVDAVTGTAIVNHGFPLHEASGRAFGAAAGFRIRTEPARPFLARIFVVAGAGEEAPIGIERERVDHVLAGIPKLFGRAIGREAIDTAGKLLGKGNERRLTLRLSAENDGAAGDSGSALRRGDDRCGRGSGGALLFADGSGIDGAVRSHGDGGDFALGGFVEDETFGSGGIFFFAGFVFGARDAQDAAARFGAGEKIIASVEG